MKTHFIAARSLAVCCSLILWGATARAEIKLPAIISDNMLLQSDITVPIWGTAKPGEQVTVTFFGQKKTTTADGNGKWLVRLDALKADTQGEMTIAGEADQATTHAEDISPPASVQFPLEREIVFLRMVVVADHNILPALQGDAIKNAITALEGVRRRLEKR